MKSQQIMSEDFESLAGWRRWYYLWLLLTWAAVTKLGCLVGEPWWWNGGRHTDGSPTVCASCGWVGRVRDCVHGYQDDGAGDVEGCSECPECGDQSV